MRTAQAMVRPNNPNDEAAGFLVQTFRRMVKPVVRFAIGRISCAALLDIVREMYVVEAKNVLAAQSKDGRVTQSSMALLCGLDGRAIKVFEDLVNRHYSPADVCSEAAIIDTWLTDADFLQPDRSGPAELLIHGPHGTFQRLVSRSAGRAVTAQTALDRLLESGNVEVSADGTKVRLTKPIYILVPTNQRNAIEAGAFAFSRLGRAVAHNAQRFLTDQPPWLQQDRWSHQIPIDRVDAVRADFRSLIIKHIDEACELLGAAECTSGETPTLSVGLGWYYWEDASDLDSPGG